MACATRSIPAHARRDLSDWGHPFAPIGWQGFCMWRGRMTDHDQRSAGTGNLGFERLLQLDRRMGRRALLGGSAGVAAAALLAACGGAANTPASSPAGSTA